MRFRLSLAVFAALLGLSPLGAQSVELSLRLPEGGSDSAFAALESGALDRFFEAGLVLTTGSEALEPDIEGLCSRARGAYIDWLLVFDLGSPAAASGEGLSWALYSSRDASLKAHDELSLPDSARRLADRDARFRALGDAAAASVLKFLRSRGGSGAAADSLVPPSGG